MPFARALVVAGAGVLALTLSSARAHAQSAQRYSVQASGLYVGTFGQAYEGLKAGPGFEAQFRISPSVWSFGFGFQASSHSFDNPALNGYSVSLAGAFFEPRRVIDVGSSQFAPYVSARLAYLQQSISFDVNGTNVNASASGGQGNLGGGVLIRLTPKVNLDLGATYGLVHFGDVELDAGAAGNTKLSGSSGNGQNMVLRAGVAIGIK